jgi:glycosyltransferase involved in cell wall biosynthesis
MACGLPSFVSDIPGNQEWVEPGIAGRWFTPGDIAALEDLLRWAPGMASDLKDYGRQARKIAEERADWGRNAPAMLEAYALALGDDRGAP